MKIYTGRGDDGTTGLLYGGRVDKDSSGPAAYGAVDEAIAALGLARSLTDDARLAETLLWLQRRFFVLGAELATAPQNRSKLKDGVSRVTSEMVAELELRIDALVGNRGLPSEFVVPGGNPVAASLDLARTVTRRAERHAVAHVRDAGIGETMALQFLNRAADYVYVLARAAEDHWMPSREEGQA